MDLPKLTQVLVTGALDPAPFAERDLELVQDAAGDFPASGRAVLFVADADLTDIDNRQALARWARRRGFAALDHGLGVVIAAPPGAVNIARQALISAFPTERPNVEYVAIPRAAQACLVLKAGPPPNTELTIHCADELDPDLVLLLQRAFSDFTHIDLTAIDGGRSNTAGIWRVDARSPDTDLHSPFVAKCGPRVPLTTQADTYRDVVADRVPYRGCAPLCLERSITGNTRRLLVSRFVERAIRLDELVADATCTDIVAIIGRIYSGPLHRWRAEVTNAEVELMPQFLSAKFAESYLPRLELCHEALTNNATTPPKDLLARLYGLAPRQARFCRAHGDINMRNVFVGDEARDIILIDFTRAVRKPLSADIARLDVGMGFDSELNSLTALPDEVLVALYSGNLFALPTPLPEAPAAAGVRLAAIGALRNQVLAEGGQFDYDPRYEYRVAVIAGLLYEAKRETAWSATAYRCADALAQDL